MKRPENLITPAELLAMAGRKPKRTKYRNVPVVVDGMRFDSKAEAREYEQLKLLKAQGALVPPFFLRQVPFHLPGRTIYRADFVVFHGPSLRASLSGVSGGWARIEVRDVKGVRTEAYKLKARQVEFLYGVKITEVR